MIQSLAPFLESEEIRGKERSKIIVILDQSEPRLSSKDKASTGDDGPRTQAS